MDIHEIIDLYEQRREQRETGLREFSNRGERKFLVIQRPLAGM